VLLAAPQYLLVIINKQHILGRELLNK